MPRRTWKGRKPHGTGRRSLLIEPLEPRVLLSATMDLESLRFFTAGSDLGVGQVAMGLLPGPDAVFTPLIQFQNGVTFNVGAGTFTNNAGDVSTVGGSPAVLMHGSYTFAANDVTGAGVAVSSGTQSVGVAHQTFEMNHFRVFDPTGGSTLDSVVRMQGSLEVGSLPGMTLTLLDNSAVDAKASGDLVLAAATWAFSGTFHVAGTQFSTPSTPFSVSYAYQPEPGVTDQFTVTGKAGLSVGSQSISIDMSSSGQGVTVQDGAVTSLGATISGKFSLAGAELTLDTLAIAYSASPEQLQVTGGTTLKVGSQVLSLSLPGQGLVIQGGQLDSLNAAFTGNVGLAGASLKMDGLAVSYTAAAGATPEQLALTTGPGGTTLKLGSTEELTIKLPGSGLVLQNNQLASLNAAFTGTLSLAGAKLTLDNLGVSYTAASGANPDRLAFTGTAGLAVGSDSLTVTMLGNGVVIEGGAVTQASANVKANFSLLSLHVVPDLTFAYTQGNTADDSTCELYGTLSTTIGSASIQATVLETLPLVINSGGWDLQSLIFDLNNEFDLFGLKVDADKLELKYYQTPQGNQYTIGGSIVIPDLFHASAQMGTAAQPGILVTNGDWDIQNLTVGLSDVNFGAFTLKELEVSIVNNSLQGVDASVQLPCGVVIDGDIQFANHHIQEIALNGENMKVPIGDTGLFLTGIGAKVDNIYAGDLTVSGTISVALGEPVTIAGHTAAIVTATGSFFVDSGQLDLTAEVKVLGGYIADGTGHINLNWGMGDYRADIHLSVYDGTFDVTGGMDFNKAHVFTIWGEADVRIPKNIPIIGGKALAGVDFAAKYDPHGDQFVAAWTQISVAGHDVWAGLEYDFQKDKLELIGHKAIDAIESKVHPDAQHIYHSDSFTFPANATGGSFELDWPTSLSSPPIYFLAPGWGGAAPINPSSDTQTISDPTHTSSQTYTVSLIDDRTAPGSLAFLVKPAGSSSPYPLMPQGNYVVSVEVQTTGQVSDVDIAGHYTQPMPTISLRESSTAFNTYSLTSTFQTGSPSASSVSLYYDYDQAGYSGTLITTISPLASGSSYFASTTATYAWDVSDLPATPLYLYALINDGVNPPQLSAYTPIPIIPQPPLAVELNLLDAPAGDQDGWLTVVTDASGNVVQRSTNWEGKQGFDLQAGSYTVTVRGHSPAYVAQPAAGQTVTADGGLSQGVTITDRAHQSIEANFSFLKQSEISGRVFEDLDADGSHDLADPGLRGWTVYADANGNGQYDIGETCSVSDATGTYRLYFPPPSVGQANTYTVRQVLPSSWWVLESPAGGSYTVSLTQQASQPAPSSSGNDFLNMGLVSLSGVAYADLDGDGTQDPGEPGLPNQSIGITRNGATVATATTDANGFYAVTTPLVVGADYQAAPQNLPPGSSLTYPVSKVFQFGAPIDGTPNTAFETSDPGDGRNYFDAVCADFNGDGYDDYAALCLENSSPTPHLTFVELFKTNHSAAWTWAGEQAPYPTDQTEWGTQLLASDLNGDGKSELILTCNDGQFYVYNVSTNAEPAPVIYASSSKISAGVHSRLALVDLNGDAHPDLFASDGYGWINDGTGKFTRTARAILPMPDAYGGVISDVVAGDFDGDGHRNDLALAYASNPDHQATVAVYVQSTHGVPSYLPAQTVTLHGTGSYYRLASADFDKNGYDDLAVANGWAGGASTNTVSIVLNNHGVMAEDQYWTADEATCVGRLVTADVDLNGYADVLWSVQGGVGALLNQGRDYFTISRNNNYNWMGAPEASYEVPVLAILNRGAGTPPGIVVQWGLRESDGGEVKTAMYQSSSLTVHAYTVTLNEAGPQPGYDFGIHGVAGPAGSAVSGMVYSDVNANGVQDLHEGGLDDAVAQLIDPSSGNVVATARTDQTGMFRFNTVTPGTYHLQLAALSMAQTTPSQPYTVTVTGLHTLGGYGFGVHLAGSERAAIQGTLYYDRNGNGAWDGAGAGSAEQGIANVLAYLDLNGNGRLDAGEPSQRTTEQGTYLFAGFRPGQVQVSYVTPAGYVPSGATSAQQKVGAGETGHGADLALATTPPVAGFGDAVNLNGTNSYVEVAPSLNNRSNWTFSAWIKPTASGSMTIYSEGTALVTLDIEVTPTQQVHVGAFRSDVTGNWANFNSPANVVKLNQWNFVAVTLANGGVGTGALTAYVNGTAYSGNLQAESSSSTTYAAIGRNIGSLHGGNQSVSAFAGAIDEVRLWYVARSQAQIQADYRQTVPADSRDLLGYWRLDDASGTNALNDAGYNPGTLQSGAAWTASTIPLSYTIMPGHSVSGTLFGADASGSALTFHSVAGPSHGTLTLDSLTGAFTYTPTPQQSNPHAFNTSVVADSFTFQAIDADGHSSSNTYSVTFTPQASGQIGVGLPKVLSFTDADGTRVTVKLDRGGASVYFLGDDITTVTRRGVCRVSGSNLRMDSIALAGNTGRATLSISARGGEDGLATLGSLTGESLRYLAAPNIIVEGDGLSLAGDVGRIGLHELRNSQLAVGGNLNYLRAASLFGSQIRIGGSVLGSVWTDVFHNTELGVGVDPGPDGIYFTADDIAGAIGGRLNSLYIRWYNGDNGLDPHGVVARSIPPRASLQVGTYRLTALMVAPTWQDGDMRVALI